MKGQPWMSVLKDVAQTATSVDTALEIIEVRLVSLSPLKGALLLMFLRVLGAAAFFCSRLASSFRTAGYPMSFTAALFSWPTPQDASRTCNLIIGVGDGRAGKAYGVEYSGYVAVPYNDTTLLPKNDTWHPEIDSVVYNGMDWDCPTYTSALGDQLTK